MARQALRKWREQADLTQEEAALRCQTSTSRWRAWEDGTSTPRLGRRLEIAERLGVSRKEVNRWFDGERPPNGHAVPRWLNHLASLEQGASHIWTYEPIAMPGLVQTRDYAVAIESVGPDPVTDEEVARKVATRIARQAVLTRETSPLVLRVVLDESVLHRVAGGPEVMADQLSHLADIGHYANITVQVLPLTAGVFSAAFGSFTLFASADSDEPYMACVEDRSGPHYLDRSPEVDAHVDLFEYLSGAALPPADSIDLVRSVAKETYR